MQLEGPELILHYQTGLTAASTDAEKGQIAAAGEGLELTAGVGDSIDLVEGIREVGYAHQGQGYTGMMNNRLQKD
jgi:hypothetical protein